MQYQIMNANGRAVVALVGTCVLFIVVAAQAGAEESNLAASTFQQRCSECHAADGSGATIMGKSANIPDLRTPEVQNQSDAGIEEIITHGKGVMPAFGTSLGNDEIQGLVQYVRGLAKKH